MKKFIGILLLIICIITLFGCADQKASSSIDIDLLKEKYPEYFDLSDFKGLEVYVCSMAENSYSFSVIAGTNRNKETDELMQLPLVSAEEMKAILDSYDTPDSEIFIITWRNPLSSYYYKMNDNYCKEVGSLFGDRYVVVNANVVE